MVKKLKQLAERQSAGGSKLFDSALAATVKESAQQIWLAGLGAFAKAQEEGGKVFEALVKEGSVLQRRTQSAAGEKLGEVTGRMSSMAGDVTAKAGQHWDKLEAIFEERTSRALARLGVPTAKDLKALMGRIDELSEQVHRLSGGAASTGGGSAAAAGRRKRAKADAPSADEPAAAGTAEAPAKRRGRRAAPAAAAADEPASVAPASSNGSAKPRRRRSAPTQAA